NRRTFLTGAALAPLSAQSTRPPNFLVILSDDQGYHDVGSYGSEIPTPHMDAIGKRGVRFERFYAAGPVCTPSRFGLLTGRYPARSHDGLLNALMPPSPKGLQPGETTIAEVLQRRGYRTALIGKWHLGASRPEFLPNQHGFDHFEGFPHGCIDYFNFTYGGMPSWFRDGKPFQPPPGYSTNYLTDQAIRYLGENRDHPFFLYLPYNAPHYGKAGYDRQSQQSSNILQAPEEYIKNFSHIADENRRVYAAMVSNLDDNIGRLREAVRQNGLEDNTFIIFLSDNGGAPDFGGANTPLRGRKADLFEGGIRVPCMMEWKNRLPAGRVIREPAGGIDLLPTLCALAKAPLPGPVDGQDLGPLLFGNRAPDRELYWRTAGGEAYIMANWKYIRQEDGEEFLFDLAADPNEATNRIRDVATLRRLKRGLERLKATMP
ncbi:MAG TPA: sulfatase-like hydrolase/transferase, partial [Bryobacteraceae bacterium]|nr:sulfatase-like hydrolase/transferase [Bryobacteraceae bacterium]